MEISKEIFDLQAEICKVLANAKRLEIIHTIQNDELSVGEIAKKMGVNATNISQHLSVMKTKGILNSRRDGIHIYYGISDPKVVDACALMKEVLASQIQRSRDLSEKL